MALDLRKRQKALERKAARAKKKALSRQKQVSQSARSWERGVVREAASWPVHEVLLSEGWRDTRELAQALVARRSAHGEVVTGTFLIDLGCLGVKSAFPSRFDSVREYEGELRAGVLARMPMMPADLNLVAKVLREAVEYAKNLGFDPVPDYATTRLILGDADPSASDETVPLGYEGKPFFAAGPYDDPKRVMAVLARKVGPDGYHFMLPLDPDSVLYRGEGDGEDLEEEEDEEE